MITLLLVLPLLHAATPGRRPASACERLLRRPVSVRTTTPDAMLEALSTAIPGLAPALAELDRVPRAGWVRKEVGVPVADAESVLDHSKRVTSAVLHYAERVPSFNARRAAWMALLHDLPEYKVGDYTPHDEITEAEKHRLEHEALSDLVHELGPDARFMLNLWLEYEARSTPTARIVYQLDKMDAAIQALEYAARGYDVEGFFTSALDRVIEPELAQTLVHMLSLRRRKHDAFHATYFERLSGKPK